MRKLGVRMQKARQEKIALAMYLPGGIGGEQYDDIRQIPHDGIVEPQ